MCISGGHQVTWHKALSSQESQSPTADCYSPVVQYRELITQFGSENEANRQMGIAFITGDPMPGMSLDRTRLILANCLHYDRSALALIGDLWKAKFDST